MACDLDLGCGFLYVEFLRILECVTLMQLRGVRVQ